MPDEKGLLLLPSLGKEVIDGFDSLSADPQACISMSSTTVWVSVCHGVAESPSFFRVALPPLTRLK